MKPIVGLKLVSLNRGKIKSIKNHQSIFICLFSFILRGEQKKCQPSGLADVIFTQAVTESPQNGRDPAAGKL